MKTTKEQDSPPYRQMNLSTSYFVHLKTSNPMRNIYLLCIALISLCACESDLKDEPIYPDLNEIGMQIVLTDPELNDLLNPESPSFLGEEYTKDITVMYLNAGKKTLYKSVSQYTNEGGTMKEWNTIYPPYNDVEGYGRVNKNTKGYYYLPFPFHKTEENQDVSYIYIQYPNGSEDELKAQMYIAHGIYLIDQMWINGELAYSMHPREGSLSTKQYYNPEYYPFLVPTLDDNGKQIGDLLQPEGGTRIVVIKKKD